MLWAITGKTAAELIADRSDSNKTHMGLTSFKGSIVRKGDITTAKNYLQQEERAPVPCLSLLFPKMEVAPLFGNTLFV